MQTHAEAGVLMMGLHVKPIRPMLANAFNGELPDGLMYSQPKLDGVRCLANMRGLWSRTGRRITACPHIERTLEPFFAAQPTAVLDGELYSHTLRGDLNAIISLVNARAPSPEKRAACEEKIQLHVFDSASHRGVFSERWVDLIGALRPVIGPHTPVRLVETTLVAGGRAHVDELFTSYLAAGCEGQMLRINRRYEHARSSALLKRKPLEDDEFILERIDEVEKVNAGYAKRVILRLPDGRTFGANILGNRNTARSLLHQKFHSVTVRFSGRTSSGIPRSPVAVAFHAEERCH